MRRSFLSVLAGMLIGATMLGSGAYAATSGILAERSPHPVTVNGQPVEIDAYLIEGHNYYQLQDLGELLGFDVVWDGATGTVRITTPDAPAAESSAGTVLLPSDGSRYIPQAGDVIRCDDGTNYTITDVSRWDKNMFAAGPVGDLPEPTCDWSLLPQPELPAPEARHYSINGREYLFVRNLYETRRMLYTLYNAIGDIEMAEWSYENGYWCSKSGSYHALIPAAAKAWGLPVEGCSASEPQRIVDALSEGKLVVALMTKGHFTSSGHFIVLRGVENEQILVADPASTTRSQKAWDLSIILNEASKSAAAGGPFWIIG